ncbi:MAG TPA: 5'-nucleotidase C-terminal domain-containing protein, partial [Clostridia bacterium]|nr:5'-nucleotidase C-terminal domain-containing protein [Clostridia bacterium]
MNRRLRCPWLLPILVVALAAPAVLPGGTVLAAETRELAILGTSDLHGNVDNYDYFTDSVPTGSSQRGLAKIQAYVEGVRAANPRTILIDNGDTIQGTPLAYYFNVLDTAVDNPLAVAMNEMDFVSATVGNHEFNFGPAVLNRYQEQADFPLLSANVTGCRDYAFDPYVIEDVDGVQVGILGLTPPAVVHWERPENIVGCVFGDAMTAANQYVPEMRAAGADVVVVSAHTGLDDTYGYGRDENFAKFLANEVPGIDVILAGHAHANVAGQLINGVLVTEPNYHGRNISDIRVTVTGDGTDWTVAAKASTTPALGAIAQDPEVLALMQPYHDAAVAYINTPIGTATAAFPGGFEARVADGPMADLINQVQMEAAAEAGFPVQASLAALFTNDAKLSAGAIKLKDAYAVYIYDNTLYVIDATGQQIKDEIEWTAGYFTQYAYEPGGVRVNPAVRDYNYDLWAGIDYTIDVTRPVGQRVVELTLDGEPIAMDQVVRVALNNYRATGRFPTAPKLYQSTVEVRELITNWIEDKGSISPEDVFVQNFELLPPVATWLPSRAAEPVARSDNAKLLWTAFGQSPDQFMKLPREKPAGTTLTREGALYLLVNRAIAPLVDADKAVLAPYADRASISAWARNAIAYAIEAAIFVPTGSEILPAQAVTNAEALAWV